MEAALVDQCRARDPEALHRVAEEFGPRIYRWVRVWTGDPEEAHDVMQETLVRFLETVDRFHGGCALSTWLYRIAHNLVSNRRRDRATRGRALRRLRPEPAPEVRRALDVVAGLPEELRAAVSLFYVEGLTLAEIAAATELPVSTIKWRLFDGRRRIRLMLEERGHEL